MYLCTRHFWSRTDIADVSTVMYLCTCHFLSRTDIADVSTVGSHSLGRTDVADVNTGNAAIYTSLLERD